MRIIVKVAPLLLVFLSTAIGGCSATLPKPNTPKTAALEVDVAYGLAAHEVNRYLAYPVCTKPLTTIPCKSEGIQAQIKAADAKAYDAVKATDALANSVNPNASALEQAVAIANAALSYLQSLTPTKENAK